MFNKTHSGCVGHEVNFKESTDIYETMCLSTETHRELGFVSYVDGNVVTRSWQEPNLVCPLGAKGQYSLIQGSWWPYRPYLLQTTRIDYKSAFSSPLVSLPTLRAYVWHA